MSRLSVHHQTSPDIPNKVLGHAEDITSTLAAVGIDFRVLDIDLKLQPGVAQAEVLSAIAAPLRQLQSDHDLGHVEVTSIDQRRWPTEHDKPVGAPQEITVEGEQRYLFLSGQGMLSLHIDDYVFVLLAERNALVSVPAGTRHWFDLGEFPYCTMVRLSTGNAAVGKPSGDDIAARFPRLED